MKEKEPANPMAAELRALRQATGMTAAEAARRAGLPPYKISRVETGAFQPKPEEVKTLCDVYGVPPDERDALVQRFEDLRQETTAHRVVLQRGGWQMQQRIGRIEEHSSLLRSYQSVMLPGLWQNELYIRRVMTPFLSADDLERTVQARLTRQRLLDTEREFHYVLAEGALRWNLCGAAGMVEQLERVIEESHRPNVTFAVIPMQTETGLQGVTPFHLYDSHAVITGTPTATAIMSSTRDVEEYAAWFERLDELAEQGDDARAVVARIADEYRAFTQMAQVT